MPATAFQAIFRAHLDQSARTSTAFPQVLWYGQPALQSVFRLGVALGGVLGLLLLAATGSADRIDRLRAHAKAVAASERAALVELYALDSRLESARSELAMVESRIAALRLEQDRARLELGVARSTLAIAEQRLGEQVRALYEQGQPDVLELVLGASSLEELLAGLDSLSRAARSTSDVVSDARIARASIGALSQSLARRARLLERLRAAAAARATELDSARIEREAYIGRLRSERRLTAERIVTLQAEAAAAQARARTVTAAVQTAPTVAAFVAQPISNAQPPGPPDDPAARRGSGNTLTLLSTGYSLMGTTATGLPVGRGIVAVDPSVIPLGTRLSIPGYGQGVAADTGPAIQGLRIDLWFPTQAAALAWGWRTVTVVLN